MQEFAHQQPTTEQSATIQLSATETHNAPTQLDAVGSLDSANLITVDKDDAEARRTMATVVFKPPGHVAPALIVAEAKVSV